MRKKTRADERRDLQIASKGPAREEKEKTKERQQQQQQGEEEEEEKKLTRRVALHSPLFPEEMKRRHWQAHSRRKKAKKKK